ALVRNWIGNKRLPNDIITIERVLIGQGTLRALRRNHRYSPTVIGTSHDLGPQVLPVEVRSWKPPPPSQRKPKLEARTWLPVSVTPTNGCGEAARRTPAKRAPTIRLLAIIVPSMDLTVDRNMMPIALAVGVGNRIELLAIVMSCGDSI